MTDRAAHSIFVNSTDAFEDTWAPFFHLLSEYWPGATTVVLNTERKSFRFPGLDIRCTQVARPGERRIPWGECMIRALDHIPTEQFVYLQDDYFLSDTVKADVVEEASRIMLAENLDCLRLMECGDAGPYEATDYSWLCSVAMNAAYRISLQAGLWTRTGMRKYLRAHESPWQMEVWGSRRASHVPGKIWAVDREVYSECRTQVVPYHPTGIVKGRWNREAVEELFHEHGIEVPYAERGWWDPSSERRKRGLLWLLSNSSKLPRYAWDRIRSL